MKSLRKIFWLIYLAIIAPVFAQLPPQIDLANLSTGDRAQMLQIYGHGFEHDLFTDRDGLGGQNEGMEFGDVNGDGFDDLIIGTFRNRLYVVFGAANLAGQEFEVAAGESGAPTSHTLLITGASTGSGANIDIGETVGCGDINGDGFDDIITGAPLVSPGGRTFAGACYVIYGAANLAGGQTIDLTLSSDVNPGPNETRILGDETESRMGGTVAANDIDGDGYDDILIRAFFANTGDLPNNDGIVVVFGSPNLPGTTIDLSASTATNRVAGETRILSENDFVDDLGVSMDGFADVDLDGFDDVVIGSPSTGEVGVAYVMHGAEILRNQLIDLASFDFAPGGKTHGTNTLPTDPKKLEKLWTKLAKKLDNIPMALKSGLALMATFYLKSPIGQFGPNLAPRLVSQTAPGLLISYPQWSTSTLEDLGAAYLVYSANVPGGIEFGVDLTGLSAGQTTFFGAEADDFIATVASGDFDGDGLGDVLLGALQASPLGRPFAARVYLIYGKPGHENAIIDLNPAADGMDSVILGEDAQHAFAAQFAAKGDMNRDGFSEFAISASGGENPLNDCIDCNEGYISVFFGSGTGTTASDTIASTSGLALRRPIGGRLSPVIRAAVAYDSGAKIGGKASLTEATIHRTQDGLGGAGLGPLSGGAPVYWQLRTDRVGFTTATIELQYTDAEVELAGIDESVLRLLRANSATGPWEEVSGASFDQAKNIVTAEVSQLGFFALAEPDPNVEILNYLLGISPEPLNGDTNGDLVVDTADLVTRVND